LVTLPAGGEGGLAVEGGEAVEGGASFFEGTFYSPKVLGQMNGGVGEFHSFPESVTGFETAGSVSTVTGRDGVLRQMLSIPGSYSNANGEFQFIKESDGMINHRFFQISIPVGP
jgi:filamentous hemagglutinin